jgi:type IV pilus assembly protein PilW
MRSRKAGFTLVELLISLVISAIVVAGALALLSSQQRTFQSSSADRAVQENARVALEELTGNLRLAGYGLEPVFAFDFGAVPSVIMDRAPAGAAVSIPAYACATPVQCRDATDGPDELVLLYRNPSFFRPLAAAPGGAFNSLDVAGPLATAIRKGQMLQVACASPGVWAYVTAGSDVPASTADVVTIPLRAGNGFAFGFQNQILADTCFGAVAPAGSPAATIQDAAKVLKVDRYRYLVQTYGPGGALMGWGTPGGRPYLMLDRGFLDGADQPVLDVVAPDVEDLQVVYVFPRSATPLAGATAGTLLADDAAGVELAPAAGQPYYTDVSSAATRATHFPANVGAVRVSIVVRTPEADLSLTDPALRALPAAGNRSAVNGPPGHRRLFFQTTAATPNLDVRAPFYPTYSVTSTDRLNVGGG